MQKSSFKALARFYGWTFNTMEDMTPAQIQIALEGATEGKQGNNQNSTTDNTIQFSTLEEWKIWKQMRGFA